MSNEMTTCKACGKEIAKGVKKCIHCGKDQRNFFLKHKIISFIIIIAIIVAVSTSLNSNDTNSNKSVTTGVAIAPVQEKAIEISASLLLKAYEDNEIKADKDYKDKLVSVSGTIDSISVMLGKTFIVINGGGQYEILGVQCYLKDQTEIDKAAELKKGQKIIITGRISGKSMNIVMNDCVINK